MGMPLKEVAEKRCEYCGDVLRRKMLIGLVKYIRLNGVN